MRSSIRPVYAALALLLLGAGCASVRKMVSREPPPPPGEHVVTPAKETEKLTEKQYLMRKATLGARQERLEAVDVLDRTRDPDLLPFLIERMEKEDDSLIQIRIMKALANAQDIRAVLPLRLLAGHNEGRVGIEAVAALYDLGDDNYIPKLIRTMRLEEYPELSGIAYRALKRIYEVELPPHVRTWNNYYRSHRLAPYQQLKWYASFKPPLPPQVAGTTKVQPRPKGAAQLPAEDVRVRRQIVSVYEFYKPDEP